MNFLPHTPQQWLIVAVVMVILEIIPPATHFFFLCLAFGALAASVVAVFTDSAWISWSVFLVSSLGLLPVLIPLAKFLFTPKEVPSNVDELIGAKAQVLRAVDAKTPGLVKMRGEEWQAVSEGERFEVGSEVKIIRLEGTRVIVQRS